MLQISLISRLALQISSGLPLGILQYPHSRACSVQRRAYAVQLASKVVHKEMYLSPEELASVSNEQSGLIDFLVLRRATKAVGISVSTFSFYLQELRLMDGLRPEDTVLMDAYNIGTDELFYSCAVTAISTRKGLEADGVELNHCKRPSGRKCWEES
jgi:hypothetical protein